MKQHLQLSPGNLILLTHAFPCRFHPLSILTHPVTPIYLQAPRHVFSGLAKITCMQHGKQGMLAIKSLCFPWVSLISDNDRFLYSLRVNSCYGKSFTVRFLPLWKTEKEQHILQPCSHPYVVRMHMVLLKCSHFGFIEAMQSFICLTGNGVLCYHFRPFF